MLLRQHKSKFFSSKFSSRKLFIFVIALLFVSYSLVIFIFGASTYRYEMANGRPIINEIKSTYEKLTSLKNYFQGLTADIELIKIDIKHKDFQRLEYDRKVALDRKRLFEELPYGENGYNRNVTRFFNTRYLPKLGLKTDKKTFHSLRHTVVDHLKQKGVEPHFINELVGHTSGNIDLDRYGKGYNPDIIFNKCVKQISYETSPTSGIDFKCLRMDWGKIVK